jgi:hypothetical protein
LISLFDNLLQSKIVISRIQNYSKVLFSGKNVGDTKCEKLPIEICGAGCVTEEGPEECHDKEIDVLVDVPEEVCDLNPQKTCKYDSH